MTFIRLDPADQSTFTIVTNPIRTFTSSSTAGITGSLNVFSRRSHVEKDSDVLSSFIDAKFDDVNTQVSLRSLRLNGLLATYTGSASAFALTASSGFSSRVESYMNAVNQLGQSTRKQATVSVQRVVPDQDDRSLMKKLIAKDQLSNYYRVVYPSSHWAYVNYNSLNFFTASTVPASSALLYPNVVGTNGSVVNHASGVYVPSGAFSFDFYIKPTVRQDQVGNDYKPGTLFHLSSTYAVSLVTGSERDHNGLPLTFRIVLQLSHSADIPPSLLKPANVGSLMHHSGGLFTKTGYARSDMAFASSDGSLRWNRWHHVVIRWGTNVVNDGTGSFNVDGIEMGTFVVPSSSIAPVVPNNPSVLTIGNYYEGKNVGSTAQALFFSQDSSDRDGLVRMINDGGGTNEPSAYTFNHQLNAEVHDLCIRRKYMSNSDIAASSSYGAKSIDSDVALYVPPFFIESSSLRTYVNTHGGILQTPFIELDGTSTEPFNVPMAFGVAGHYINLENYVKDFANNVLPRLHQMTGTVQSQTSVERSANEFLYDQPFVRRRNTMIVPCDDGNFVPGFELLASESLRTRYVDDLGVEELSMVNVGSMLSTASLLFGPRPDEDTSFIDDAVGFTPEQPGLAAGIAFSSYARAITRAIANDSFTSEHQTIAPLTVYQRTRDASSNQVTIFDVSNLYYGKRILPTSIQMSISSLSGSSGAIPITLRDDGRGGLYRCNCATSASTWNSVGTVYYDEGLIVIKNPHLMFFGLDDYEISFKGEHNVHVMSYEVTAPAGMINSSSNPTFVKVPPTEHLNDVDEGFVYISGINFHDENFNVVMKTQLAQPIRKRDNSRITFKVKVDV